MGINDNNDGNMGERIYEHNKRRGERIGEQMLGLGINDDDNINEGELIDEHNVPPPARTYN